MGFGHKYLPLEKLVIKGDCFCGRVIVLESYSMLLAMNHIQRFSGSAQAQADGKTFY